ncbi:MAG: hypothetical protein FWG73_00020 [Planctomycetaceae bacterium]|nr:hypothetical protein [Planctomycetaceae bacterium]
MRQTFRQKNEQGIAYSVFPFGSARQMFLVGEPAEHAIKQADPPEQVKNLLENVKSVCEEQGFSKNTAGMCSIFLANIAMRELVRQRICEICPHILGAVTFIPQAPVSGASIALELWTMHGNETHFFVEDKSEEHNKPDDFGDRPLGQSSVAEFDDMRWFFGGRASPETSAAIGAYARSQVAFRCLDDLMADEGFQLGQLIRTWIYQGHLVLAEGDTQRYKELNRARTDFFEDIPFLDYFLPEDHTQSVYPASTGIGADDFDVVISAIALDTTRDDVIAVPLENPNQTSAFDYGTEYSPQSPKFSRAMAVAVEDTCLIFVSGTASITNSESRHPEDPAKQTEQTLDNIADLISGNNLARHGIEGFACGLENLESVRVYVKRRSDLELIREVCERRLPAIPTIYTIADVCREELLVEIEGIAVTKLKPEQLAH